MLKFRGHEMLFLVKADGEHTRLLAANEARARACKVEGQHLPAALWFDLQSPSVKQGEGLRYRSNGKYWISRESGSFASPDIFGLKGRGAKAFVPED